MQQLFVVGRLFPQIISGEKTSTIRWREAQIVPGPMRYVNLADTSQSVVVTVLRCTEMPLFDVARFLDKETEWPEDVMLAGMRQHYPAIGWHDCVQVIQHTAPVEQ